MDGINWNGLNNMNRTMPASDTECSGYDAAIQNGI